VAEPERVRQDQPTITTLEAAMAAAVAAADDAFSAAGFKQRQVVVNAVLTSLDPDDGWHTWVVGSRVPDKPDSLLAATLRRSADEADHVRNGTAAEGDRRV
jgi:hypothetical protein